MAKNVLAYYGGKKAIKYLMPRRKSVDTFEVKALNNLITYYKKNNKEIGFQDHYENLYCKKFSKFLGGGYSDVVASGTLALMNAIQALELPKGSEILTSPINDPGALGAIILLGHKPKLIDSEKKSYGINFENLKKRTTKNTKAVLLVHPSGQSVKMKKIVNFLKKKKIYLIEDCSQAHGAKCFGCKGCSCKKKVGTFGDIAAFSTMYKKTHATGSTGGVVFTKNRKLHLKALAYADRGKPIWKGKVVSKNPKKYLFPSYNINSNEFSCAIGISSLNRINKTIRKRINLCKYLKNKFKKYSKFCEPAEFTKFDSPFFIPVYFKETKIVQKKKFANMLMAEGVPCNDHYNYLVSEWPWIKRYLKDNYKTINAEEILNNSFNVYINENYSYKNIDDMIYAVQKVEKYFLKN